MKEGLRPRNRGHRSEVPSRQNPNVYGLSRFGGLEGAIAGPPQRATPPGASPAARRERDLRDSTFYGIVALPILALDGGDREPHLPAHHTGQETTDAVSLPSGSFLQLLRRRSAGPFQQIEDLGCFTAVAANRGLPETLGRLLGRVGLRARLRLSGCNVAPTWRNRGLPGGFWRLARHRGWDGDVFFCDRRGHLLFSLSGEYRVHDMNRSEAHEKQPKSEGSRKRRWNGDAGRQMSVGVI